MLRIAIIETESVAKDIMFELALLLQDQEWTFQYFNKISQFAKAEAIKDFQLVVFHERLETPRVTQAFITHYPQRIVLYTKAELTKIQKELLPFSRIFYINRNHIHDELKRILPSIKKMIKNQDEYLFSYNNVTVPLKISDIYYIEKQDKYLIYHSKRGVFRERKNMKDAYLYFEPYNFLWVHASYLVNIQYVTKIESDFIFLQDEIFPISRSKKADVTKKIRSFIQ